MVFIVYDSDTESCTTSPAPSPRASSGCVGFIRKFTELLLQDLSRDGGAVEKMLDDNPGRRNGSAGEANQIALMMKKLVVKVELYDAKGRYKVMRVVSGFAGIGSLSMDPNANKLTVSGDFDPVKVVKKLRKSWHTDIVSVGATK